MLWWLVRYDLRMLPAYVATGSLLGVLTRAIQIGTPDAWLLFAVQAAVAAAMAWIVTRYIDRALVVPDPLPTGTTGASPTSE